MGWGRESKHSSLSFLTVDAVRSATTVHQVFPTIMGYIPLLQEPKSTFLKLFVIATRQVTNSSSKVLGGQTFGTWCSLAIQSKVIVMETTYTKKHKILLWEHCVQPCSTKDRTGSAPWGNLLAQWGWGGVQARYCTSSLSSLYL